MAYGLVIPRGPTVSKGRTYCSTYARAVLYTSGSKLDSKENPAAVVYLLSLKVWAVCAKQTTDKRGDAKRLSHLQPPCNACAALGANLRTQVLTFGSWFDRPLAGVRFPDTLTTLALGRDFNQPLEGIQWPQRLARLTFGFFFNRSIRTAAKNWPATLKHISLGDCYNLPVEDVEWPRGLEEVRGLQWLSNKHHHRAQEQLLCGVPLRLTVAQKRGGCERRTQGGGGGGVA